MFLNYMCTQISKLTFSAGLQGAESEGKYTLDTSPAYHMTKNIVINKASSLRPTSIGNLELHYCAWIWTKAGSQMTWREPTQTWGEHVNYTQKGPRAGNQTLNLLAHTDIFQ